MKIIALLTILITSDLLNSTPAFAEACSGSPCFQGIYINQPNHGAVSNISTRAPNYINPNFVNPYDGLFSYMLINSQTPPGLPQTQIFIQTGWAFTVNYTLNNCGGGPKFFWEYIDYTAKAYRNQCLNYYPALFSTHTYTVEYDSNTNRWCYDYDGQCLNAVYATNDPYGNPVVGSDTGVGIAAYGEVNDSRIQMGGPDMNNPVVMSRIGYKPNTTGSFNPFTVPPLVYQDSYGACQYDSRTACNYQHRSFGDSTDGNRLLVQIWSNRIFS